MHQVCHGAILSQVNKSWCWIAQIYLYPAVQLYALFIKIYVATASICNGPSLALLRW